MFSLSCLNSLSGFESSKQRISVPPSKVGEMALNAFRRIGQPRPQHVAAPQLPARVAGTSFYLPDNLVTNQDLERQGFDNQWIVQRTGIRSRHLALAHQSTSDLATGAAIACLANAGVAAEELDLILVATCTPDHIAPSVSCLVQQNLGCDGAAAFDLNAACSGFMYGYITACQFVASGSYKNVLVIGADVLSRCVDPADRKTYPLFGDGAAAVLLQPSGHSVVGVNGRSSQVALDGNSGVLGFQLGAEGSLGQSLLFPAGGSREPITQQSLSQGDHFLKMDGRTVFKWAVQLIPQVINRLLHRCEFPIEDVSMFVLHQANTRILDAAMDGLQVSPDRIWSNVQKYGNTCAASVPLVLAEAQQAGRIQPGDHIVMCGFGAGLTWGTALVRW